MKRYLSLPTALLMLTTSLAGCATTVTRQALERAEVGCKAGDAVRCQDVTALELKASNERSDDAARVGKIALIALAAVVIIPIAIIASAPPTYTTTCSSYRHSTTCTSY